jgi:hypothetical protein
MVVATNVVADMEAVAEDTPEVVEITSITTREAHLPDLVTTVVEVSKTQGPIPNELTFRSTRPLFADTSRPTDLAVLVITVSSPMEIRS